MKLTIESMTYGPDGLARTDDGKAVFVTGGGVGDEVSDVADHFAHVADRLAPASVVPRLVEALHTGAET